MRDIRIIRNWEGREKCREYIYDKKEKLTSRTVQVSASSSFSQIVGWKEGIDIGIGKNKNEVRKQNCIWLCCKGNNLSDLCIWAEFWYWLSQFGLWPNFYWDWRMRLMSIIFTFRSTTHSRAWAYNINTTTKTNQLILFRKFVAALSSEKRQQKHCSEKMQSFVNVKEGGIYSYQVALCLNNLINIGGKRSNMYSWVL